MTMERDAVVQILLRERLRVAAVATAIVRDVHAADDIFQQVVLSALEHADQFHDPHHILAWAIRVARHRAVDLAHRRRMLSLPDEVLDLFEAQWSDPAPAAWSDRVEALHRCLGRLAAPTRELLQMKYSQGLTAAVIAGKLCRSADAVYQNLSRAHRALRECVERQLVQVDFDRPARGGVS
jgi:RNA polymerase sigma-70 factor, ECF subfamily